MQVVFDSSHSVHAPSQFLVAGRPTPSPEVPERAERLSAAAVAGGHRLVPPRRYGRGPVAAVHTPEYLAFLEEAWSAWQTLPNAGAEVLANVHPRRRDEGYPASIVGRAGYHMADSACPIGARTFAAALGAADAALTAAELVAEGARVAYALCRPPGHHAFADQAGGFCYLNNAAIAAQHLRGLAPRVAILDVDVHHGNGTQGIFYERADVLTLSLHADPSGFYPFFWGHAQERGAGAGLGFNLNLPLARGSGEDVYLPALQGALKRIADFAPGFLVVALGLDAHEGDPFRGLALTTEGFGRIAAAVAGLGLPTVLVQEGGYLNDALGANLAGFLAGFEGA